MNLLTDESPQVYHPTLAAWVGLNEAVFLAQLHYILTKNDKVGQVADGRKWYRDKPHDFVVKYFPFWDEGIVKRVIDNLRADGLILARSDLNKDPKDRSLWYTIHYEAIERLSSPVERIVNKSAKRKEARQARKPKIDSDNYTKVQNVLLNDNPTNCTFDPGTKCTSEKVQNVPTPKESLPKDSKPKESKELSPKQKMFLLLADLCRINLKASTEKQKGQLGTSSKALIELVPDLDQFKVKFPIYWQKEDWRGQKGQPPTPPQIQEVYGDYCYWLANGETYPRNGAIKNGQHSEPNQKTRGATGESLDDQPVYDPSTQELIHPDGRREPYRLP